MQRHLARQRRGGGQWVHLQKLFGADMRRRMGWLKHHRLLAFFVLAYTISWGSWPVYAAGLMPRMEFLSVGPLAAAVIVIALAEGRPGFRAWGRRLVRWRVGWVWYAVAILLPVVFVLVTGFITMALGAAARGLAQLTWTGLLTVFAVRLVNPLDGALGEEPGFRGYALPLLQATRPPLLSAAILGVLVTLWHLPLVLFIGLSPIGLPTTFAITFLYVWLFNRTGGSVLLTLLFHNSQGTFTVGSFGFTAANAGRAELIYFLVVVLAVLATVVLDRRAWRKAPRSATAVGRFPLGMRPM
jgi:membrane protease YdiL (CAAX protease family)